MKKIVLTFTVLMLAIAGMAQDKTSYITINHEKGVFASGKTGSVTHFVLTATAGELKAFKEKISQLPYARLEVKKAGEHTYNCKLSLSNSPDAQMVRRTLGHAGYEQFRFDGKEKNAEELPGVLQQLQ